MNPFAHDRTGTHRFLFATTPLPGHVNPGLSIARALVERGHEVRWYTGRAHADPITATGATWEPMVDGYDPAVQPLEERYPERSRLEGIRGLKYDLKHLFLDEAPAYVRDLEALLQRQPADVVVVDTAFLAGRLIHERGGPPYASFGISILPLPGRDVPPPGTGKTPASTTVGRLAHRLLTAAAPRLLFGDLQRHQQGIRQQLGLAPTGLSVIEQMASPFLYLQGSTASFEYPRTDLPPHVHYVGPLLPPTPRGAATPEPWLTALGTDRPLVLVNQGTVATDPRDLVVPALEAFAGDDVDVVTTGVAPEAVDRAVPANVHVRSYVPFADLLPRVSVTVTNGGFGSVQAALAHGVPLVVAGTSEDKRDIAARVAWNGAGIRLPVRSPSPDVLRRAVHDVLDDPAYRQRAEAFRQEIAASEAGPMAADLLEALAATGRPVTSAVHLVR
jgi:MGT family glycosyltransferase